MKLLHSSAIFAATLIVLSGCGSKSSDKASNSSPAATQAPASTQPAPAASPPPTAAVPTPAPTPSPATLEPATPNPAGPAPGQTAERVSPATGPAAPQAPVAPPPPPPPVKKTYTLPAGTPIIVRTVAAVNTKVVKSGNEFQAVLESPLAAEGHTFAKTGATVVGTVVNADQGGRVKGKASLTLALARIQMTNGKMISVMTDNVTQQAKSGTKKNVVRTGIATGVGAAIGGIAGGGQGAAIGAGVGAGAGVATDLATRGPAADVPAETVLNFTLKNDISVTVTEKPAK